MLIVLHACDRTVVCWCALTHCPSRKEKERRQSLRSKFSHDSQFPAPNSEQGGEDVLSHAGVDPLQVHVPVSGWHKILAQLSQDEIVVGDSLAFHTSLISNFSKTCLRCF